AALVFLMMVVGGASSESIEEIVGIAHSTVFADIEKIRNPAPDNKKQWGGGNNFLMTPDDEEQFLSKYLDESKKGLILTVNELHQEYNNVVGKVTPKSTIYRILKRHGWRKVAPDKRHPKADPAAQEEFKKKHSKWKWVKL
ncbi:MAG: winged helix-turn-helix domain-containing protein, partial [Deltaproteobacteria bacterium]|nr:winged helix-turn-helix domain-containing protein [Deltaproteobacteria bacterium]